MNGTEDVKKAVAANIASLRTACGMTQLDLAKKLNYTDKAVSKWERAESVPDLAVLKEIAVLFGVSVDYLLTETHEKEERPRRRAPANKRTVVWLSVLAAWLLATATFVFFRLIAPEITQGWLALVYAAPASVTVWLVLNTVWFDPHRNYLIVSVLLWAVLAAVYASFLAFDRNYPLVFLLGVPGQIIVVVWSKLHVPHKKHPET